MGKAKEMSPACAKLSQPSPPIKASIVAPERFVLKGFGIVPDPGEYWVAPRYVYASEYEKLDMAIRASIAHLDQPVLHSGSSGDGAADILRGDINIALKVMRDSLCSVPQREGGK